jgi:hypothetical protein
MTDLEKTIVIAEHYLKIHHRNEMMNEVANRFN